jgi:hypothetical protein
MYSGFIVGKKLYKKFFDFSGIFGLEVRNRVRTGYTGGTPRGGHNMLFPLHP